ncbi:MAG: YdcF family protein [Gammaproteobacteria bacterium]
MTPPKLHRIQKVLALTASALAAIVILSEAAYRLGRIDLSAAQSEPCLVLVLGFPSLMNGSPHPLQRFRVESGVDVYRRLHCRGIVLSGGAAHNRFVEAETMATVARSLGVPKRDILLESQARNTWENIGCSKRLRQTGERLLIVSDSLHVHRAKRYACRQSSELCAKAYAVGFDPPWSLAGWKVAVAVNELATALRDLIRYQWAGADNAPVCSE